MRKIQGILLALTLGIASMAHAQATRTWVSGVGDDANPCSRTAPCKTFAGAISKTATGGIINAIDSAGFGAVTISKAITIDASPFMGGVLQSGATAVIVNAISTSNVTLRGLDIEGVSAATNGVRILTAASVVIENCQIYGFSRGISGEGTVSMNVTVNNSTIKHNTNGIFIAPTGGTTKLAVDDSLVAKNSSNGILTGSNTEAFISNSTITGNGATGVRIEQATSMALESTTITANSTGLECGVAGAATCTLSRTLIVRNTTRGLTRSGDGVSGHLGIATGFSNNVITNNGALNTVNSSVAQQ
jgi:hypothetical protein